MGTKTKLILAMRLQSSEEHSSIHYPQEAGRNLMDRFGVKTAKEPKPKAGHTCAQLCDFRALQNTAKAVFMTTTNSYTTTINQHRRCYHYFNQTLHKPTIFKNPKKTTDDQLSLVHSNPDFLPSHLMLSDMNHNEQQLCSSAQLPQKSIGAVLWFVMLAACAVLKTLSKHVMSVCTSTGFHSRAVALEEA